MTDFTREFGERSKFLSGESYTNVMIIVRVRSDDFQKKIIYIG